MTNAKVSAADKALALIEKYELTKEKFMKKMQKQFNSIIKELFKNHKIVGAVTWTQYTPYFNDGEPCEFGVHDKWILSKKDYKKWLDDRGYPEEYDISSVDWDAERDEDGNRPLLNKEITREELKEIEKFMDVLSKIPDELYLGMFGDHVQVIVTRKGIQVEEYYHD